MELQSQPNLLSENITMTHQIKKLNRITLILLMLVIIFISASIISTSFAIKYRFNNTPKIISIKEDQAVTKVDSSKAEVKFFESKNPNKPKLALSVDATLAKDSNKFFYDTLEENQGLLIVYPSSSFHYVWTKNFKVPVDIIWISDDDVVDVKENITPQYQKDILTEAIIYGSSIETNKVIFVKEGLIKEKGISKNDQVQLNFL